MFLPSFCTRCLSLLLVCLATHVFATVCATCPYASDAPATNDIPTACGTCPALSERTDTATADEAETTGDTKPPPIARERLTRFTPEDAARARLSLTEAAYWQADDDDDVVCSLCPHRCLIPSGYRGRCRVRVNVDGTLYTVVYGRPVAVHVDPIEKKPLYHFHPRSRTFSFATAGCNLRCVFCQNWQISQARPEQTRYILLPPEELVAAAINADSHSISYTYTEATVFYEYMRDTAKIAHEKGLQNVWVTCGYIEEEPLRALAPYLDAVNVDLKGFSDTFYRTYTAGTLEPVLRTLRILQEEGVWIEITNLVIPGANDADEDFENLCAWVVETLGKDVPLHFSRFRPDYRLRDRPPTPIATLERAVSIAQEHGIRYVYTGNVVGHEHADTRCHACGETVIKRRGYVIEEMRLDENNACASCGTPLHGRFDGAE